MPLWAPWPLSAFSLPDCCVFELLPSCFHSAANETAILQGRLEQNRQAACTGPPKGHPQKQGEPGKPSGQVSTPQK